MTQPNPVKSQWDSLSSADSQSAMSGITSMMTGTKVLQDEPGIVYALAAQRAHPADAQAIDQFMQGLNAEKQVRLAQATGVKIHLSDDQKTQLGTLGVDYSQVAWTTQDAQNAAAKAIAASSGGKQQATKNADGTYLTNGQGNLVPQMVPVAEHLTPKYKAKGIGRLFQTLHNDVLDPIGRDVAAPVGAAAMDVVHHGIEPVGSALMKGFNTLNSVASDSRNAASGGLDGGKNYGQSVIARSEDMKAEGYDPTNPWSALAFQASGKAHGNTQPIADMWDTDHPSGMLGMNGREAVSAAESFLNDPSGYRRKIMSDPANFTVDPKTHQASATPGGAAKLEAMNSPEFADIARRVNDRSATVGNDVTNAIYSLRAKTGVLGSTPAGDSQRALMAAGVNLAVSFAIDPTIVALKIQQAAKISRIGIDTLGDVNGAVSVLDGSRGANEVQRGWQQMIDLTTQMRDAHAAGDAVKVAGLQSKIDSSLPGLAPMTQDFLGTQMLKHPSQWEKGVHPVSGEDTLKPTYEAGPGIRSLGDAANYVGSRYALVRLMNGRAATQASLMPGALSAFGWRKLKGATSEWLTERSLLRQGTQYDSALSKITADPARAKAALAKGDIERVGPAADDAVNALNDNVIAHKPLVNLHDDVKVALAKATEKAATTKTAIQGANAQLDELETRLHGLQGDSHADPGHLAALQDQIQAARDAVSSHEAALATHGSAQANLEQVSADMAAQENAAQTGLEVANHPIMSKSALDKSVNSRDALSPEVSYALTGQGKGKAAFNVRRTGVAEGDAELSGPGFGWSSPTAIAARSRLASQRFTNLLPRNGVIDINDPQSALKLKQFAMTFLNRGDANAFESAWNLGDGGVRKQLAGSIMDQVGHSAGLGHSVSGQKILDTMKTQVQAYNSAGDEIVVDGQVLAQHAGQVASHWVLPAYKDIQIASKKLGLWEATMGRALTTRQTDVLMQQWKLPMLAKPGTVTRNMVEGLARAALGGVFGDAMHARALLTVPNKELWAHGFELDVKAEHDALVAAGNLDEAKAIANGNRLSGRVTGRSTPTDWAAQVAPLALVARAWRHAYGWDMTEPEIKAFLTLNKDEISTMMHEYGQQTREAELGTRQEAKQAGEVTKAGWGPAKIRYAINDAARKGDPKVRQGARWTQQDTDGTLGADRYVNALAQRINATPSITRAVIDHLHDPEQFPLDHVIKAMDDPAIAGKMRLTPWGRYTWDDPQGPGRLATSHAEIANGKPVFAQKIVNDYRHLFTGQNGQLQEKLTRKVYEDGRAPASDWIAANLKGDNRPESVLAPEVMAMPNGGERSVVQTLQDIQGGGFEWMVERPLHRMVSGPVMMANYVKARVGMNDIVDRLVHEHGFTEEASGNLAKEISVKNSWVATENMIDDPGQKSQFDVVARNMFPFSRATQAMIRRWGTGLWQNPVAARKLMLAYEGGTHSGLIYNNAYGEPTFTYPGSGVLNMAMREISKIPGFEALNYFPMSSTMTGGALMAVPGADNPFRMGMGPMMSIPMRELFGLFPNHRAMLDEVDGAINGPIGVGQTWSQLLPASVKRFYGAMPGDQRNSALASSTVGAMANLAAAGVVPAADASPAVRDAFKARVATQTRNQLLIRALFGLVAPAAPSAPQDQNTSTGADYVFQESGMKTLSDEFKTIFNETGGDVGRAMAVWTTLHPDLYITKPDGTKVVTKMPSAITVPHTHATTSKVSLPATAQALNWMEANTKFIGKYRSVAAYFMPQSAGTDQPFNDHAYNTQIELGMRQRKTPDEFYTDTRIRNAESQYYPALDGFNKRIAAAKAAGDTALMGQWTTAKSQWSAKFKAQNPLFGQKIASYPDARATALGQLADLHGMLKGHEVPAGQGALLQQLVQNYEGYASFIGQHPGQHPEAKALRDGALKLFNDWAEANVAGSPLADLYSGVFRTLNTNIVDVNA